MFITCANAQTRKSVQAKRIICWAAAVGIVAACASSAFAADDSYVRGYTEALLDTRFADKKVKVLSVQGERVLLAVGGCLSEAARTAIELALLATARVKGVDWSDFVRCEDAAPPVSPPVAVVSFVVVVLLPPYSIFVFLLVFLCLLLFLL